VTEMETIRQNLWNVESTAINYPDAAYQRDLMKQYELCLQMADRISARRSAANTFFLSINTAVVGAIGMFFVELQKGIPDEAVVVVYLVAIVFCIAWSTILQSYRNINTAKFKVIGLIEERLPSSPFYSAEWQALGSGKDWSRYIPLSVVERTLPAVFVVAYICLGIITLTK